MKKILLATTLLCSTFPALAQVYPSLPITPGHLPVWVQGTNKNNPIIKDAGPAPNGSATELGITNTGTPLCINDVKITSTTGYHQFCIGANSLGGGLISYNAYGAAPKLPLNINVNGVTYPFPGTGMGNVVGPSVTHIDHVAVWNNTGGTLLSDPGVPITISPFTMQSGPRTIGGTYNFRQTDLSSSAIGSFPVDFSGIASILTSTPGSTVNNVNGVSTYIHNRVASSGIFGPNTVGLMSQVYSEVNNSDSWAINGILNDVPGVTGTNLQNEFDCNVVSTGTRCFGLVVTGFSTVTPNASAAFVAAPPSLQSPGLVTWGSGSFWSEDAASLVALQIGATGLVGPSVPSQLIDFNYYDSSSVSHTITIGATSTDSVVVNENVPGGFLGFSIFNNVSTTTNTGAFVSLNTVSGAGILREQQVSSSSAALLLSNASTGGINIAPGTGGIFILNLSTGAHSGTTTCLGIDTVTGKIFASTTVTTC